MKGAVEVALICFGSALSILFSITDSFQYQDFGMINEMVCYWCGHGSAVEYLPPVGEWPIQRYYRRSFSMPLTDYLEKQIRTCIAQR